MPQAAAVVPPVGFDPISASSADLACYGFPARHSGVESLRNWNATMANAKHYVYPASALTNPVGQGLPYATFSSSIWAGYHARANQNTQWPYARWTQAEGTTIVRTASTTTSSTCSGRPFGQWVGLGGDTSGNNLSQTGVEESAGNPTHYRLWWQVAGDQSPVTIIEVPVKPGDSVYLSVTYNLGQNSSTFFVQDSATGAYTSFTKGAGDPTQDIDFEVEEPGAYPSGPFINFPHIPMSQLGLYGVWGSSGQYSLIKNLSQVNSIHDHITDDANHVVVDPNAYGSEPYGFDDYANSTYTQC